MVCCLNGKGREDPWEADTLQKKTGHNQKTLLWRRTTADRDKGTSCLNKWHPELGNCFLQWRKSHAGFRASELKAGLQVCGNQGVLIREYTRRGICWMRAFAAEPKPWKVSRNEFHCPYPRSPPLRERGKFPLRSVCEKSIFNLSYLKHWTDVKNIYLSVGRQMGHHAEQGGKGAGRQMCIVVVWTCSGLVMGHFKDNMVPWVRVHILFPLGKWEANWPLFQRYKPFY